MAYARPNPRSSPSEPPSESDVPFASRHALDHLSQPQVEHPRLVEEHHVVGPHGEDKRPMSAAGAGTTFDPSHAGALTSSASTTRGGP